MSILSAALLNFVYIIKKSGGKLWILPPWPKEVLPDIRTPPDAMHQGVGSLSKTFWR